MTKMVEVTQEDANNYCRVLTALGMEEEGDPVQKIESMLSALTAEDVLKLMNDRAQWCRENGESDMRNILNTVRSIRDLVRDGRTRAEVLAFFADDEDDDA